MNRCIVKADKYVCSHSIMMDCGAEHTSSLEVIYYGVDSVDSIRRF